MARNTERKVLEVEIDGTRYGWEHAPCHCPGHCGIDRFYVDGEFHGEIDNPALCSFIRSLVERVKSKMEEKAP